jgi:hypothetical protein
VTWHHTVVTIEHLAELVDEIRGTGGTVTGCRAEAGGVLVTWTTPSSRR